MFKDAKDYDIKLPHPNLGYTASAETRAKISAAITGKTRSAENKAKISAAKQGKPGHPISEETKAKLRAANLGKTLSEETRAKIGAAKSKYVYYTPAGGPFTRNAAIAANNCGTSTFIYKCRSKTFPDWYRVKKVDNT
jgi:hypothetical protein